MMSQYICSHCSKCYKSESWFNKHMKTHETKTEAPIQQVAKQVINADDKPFLKTEKFLDTDLFYTIKGIKTAGDKYYSPQQAALEKKTLKNQIVIAKGKMLKSGKEGKSYGCIDINKLDSGVNLGVNLSTNGSELGRMFVRREDWMNGRSAMRKSNDKHT